MLTNQKKKRGKFKFPQSPWILGSCVFYPVVGPFAQNQFRVQICHVHTKIV